MIRIVPPYFGQTNGNTWSISKARASGHCGGDRPARQAMATEPAGTVVPTGASRLLRAPRAAAVAGILFSVLLMISLWLLRESVPEDPLDAGAWLATKASTVVTALNLVPFAGIAFLWFIGVLRDRLGALEDRLLSTVFLGSGLLFLSMLFHSAAVAGGLIVSYTVDPTRLLGSTAFTLGRAIVYEVMNIYAVRMAGVFMMVTSTMALRTRFIARWIAFVGYALALLMLLSNRHIERIVLVFPLWVLLVSVFILIDEWRRPSRAPRDAGSPVND
ncbi:MAG: hypothetical protein V5B39_10415 [Accumulibacter sp.]|jgi:hypothetical protein|uniref:hypothetical protein n=1 Tax=Accumulibacter sp. TaxID=2053492 RepID=UPI002FC2825A